MVRSGWVEVGLGRVFFRWVGRVYRVGQPMIRSISREHSYYGGPLHGDPRGLVHISVGRICTRVVRAAAPSRGERGRRRGHRRSMKRRRGRGRQAKQLGEEERETPKNEGFKVVACILGKGCRSCWRCNSGHRFPILRRGKGWASYQR
jgi:hypothetical protein